MTPIEAVLTYIALVFGYGSYSGTNDKLAAPYKTFQNSYLKITIKKDSNKSDVDSRFHRATFGLRAIPSVSVFHINPKTYPLSFNRDKQVENYFKFLPSRITQSPSEYFLENCEYTTKLPTNVSFEIGIGFYSLTDSIKLMPNQTIQIRMESINGELRSETNNLKSYEIIPTPIDVQEIQKCDFEIEAKDK